jgi:hypothetical protein
LRIGVALTRGNVSLFSIEIFNALLQAESPKSNPNHPTYRVVGILMGIVFIALGIFGSTGKIEVLLEAVS